MSINEINKEKGLIVEHAAESFSKNVVKNVTGLLSAGGMVEATDMLLAQGSNANPPPKRAPDNLPNQTYENTLEGQAEVTGGAVSRVSNALKAGAEAIAVGPLDLQDQLVNAGAHANPPPKRAPDNTPPDAIETVAAARADIVEKTANSFSGVLRAATNAMSVKLTDATEALTSASKTHPEQ